MTVALHDITVLDFSQGLSGPFCSLLLGDLGARVLKVEPLEGDWARQLEPRQGNHSAVFLALNRNKTSIALDYQSAAGQEVVQRLARRADMVLYDAHPKHARALGLDYATLAAQNPQLIYGLLTPFGEHGPWAQSGCLGAGGAGSLGLPALPRRRRAGTRAPWARCCQCGGRGVPPAGPPGGAVLPPAQRVWAVRGRVTTGSAVRRQDDSDRGPV